MSSGLQPELGVKFYSAMLKGILAMNIMTVQTPMLRKVPVIFYNFGPVHPFGFGVHLTISTDRPYVGMRMNSDVTVLIFSILKNGGSINNVFFV